MSKKKSKPKGKAEPKPVKPSSSKLEGQETFSGKFERGMDVLETFTRKFKREMDALGTFGRSKCEWGMDALGSLYTKEPRLFVVVALCGLIFISLSFYTPWLKIITIPKLEETIKKKDIENIRLTKELAPFRALALHKYPDDPDSLNKLAQDGKLLDIKIESVLQTVGDQVKNLEYIKRILENITQINKKQLSQTYASYEVVGILDNKIILPDIKPSYQDFYIDWKTVTIKPLDRHFIDILIGYMLINGHAFSNASITIENKFGATVDAIKYGNILLQFKVIAIQNDLVIIAAGFSVLPLILDE